MPNEVREGELSVSREHDGFVDRGSDTQLVHNGTFVNNRELFPNFGYQKYFQIADKYERRKQDLPELERAYKLEDSRYYTQNEFGPANGFINYKNLLLGHTRLSIIDISNLGSQPMSVDGRYWIIYNGEIYNYRALRDELILKKYKFYSNSDTEVVLNAYKEWGVE